jgi:hypothetical protein
MLALEGMMNAQRNRGMSLGAPTLSLSADHTRSTDVVSKKSKSLSKKKRDQFLVELCYAASCAPASAVERGAIDLALTHSPSCKRWPVDACCGPSLG